MFVSNIYHVCDTSIYFMAYRSVISTHPFPQLNQIGLVCVNYMHIYHTRDMVRMVM